ncbi:Photosystem II 22 kDa protein 1, chloroplastic [Linum perenne]
MAQTMLLSSSLVSTTTVSHSKRDLHLLINNPTSSISRLPSQLHSSSSRSRSLSVVALFKSKTKAAPKKLQAPPPPPKVEDGIFGTSGGIGFTKQNELFVGRVAMIGFAASLLGEAVTGKGILSQLNLETGIPIYEAEPLLLFFILFTLLGAIGALGDRGRFVDEEPTGLDKAIIAPGKGLRGALGLPEGGPLFGFTKANELFVGRLAQLGIAFSLIGEVITGKGALAQLNIETGIPINEIEPLVLFNVLFFFIAALNPGTGKFVTDDEEK